VTYGRIPNRSIIDHIRESLPHFSKSQRQVADIILLDIEAATRLTTQALAAQAKVSEPTIVRFARRMGSIGFTDFKLRLSQDFATGQMFVPAESSPTAQGPAMVASQVYEATAQALAYSFAQRDPAALGQAAAIIDAARRLFCLGVGGSSANVAAEAANRLFRFDVAATATADPYAQTLAAALCDESDALLIFSVTGKPVSLVSSATLAHARGAAVIAVTRPDSPLAQAASLVIGLDIPDDDQRFEIPNRSRYGQFFVLDCLATLLAGRRGGQAAPKLERARQALQDLHGATAQQPIGD
jgi:RpiR family carbohydrate utilization transcriptional regulator